jgi:hypothetical protein
VVNAEGIKNGLDFEQAVNDPDLVQMVTSTQVQHSSSSTAQKQHSYSTAQLISCTPVVLAQQGRACSHGQPLLSLQQSRPHTAAPAGPAANFN